MDDTETTEGPWWTRTLWQMGPLVFGFIVLLGVVTGFVPSPITRVGELEHKITESTEEIKELRASQDAMRMTLSSTTATAAETAAKLTALNIRLDEQTRLMRAICRNTARTDFTRESCDR